MNLKQTKLKIKRPIPKSKPDLEDLKSKAIEITSLTLPWRKGIPYSDLELGLGTLSFIYWLIRGGDTNDSNYFETPNVSARYIAIEFCEIFLLEEVVINSIKKRNKRMNLELEISLAKRKVYNFDPYWNAWELSLVRSIIMITRVFAYLYTGTSTADASFQDYFPYENDLNNLLLLSLSLIKKETNKECFESLLDKLSKFIIIEET